MTTDDAPTGVAPTDLVELAEAEAHTAWSQDYDDEWESPRRSWRPVIAAVVASLFVAGVAGGIAVDHLRPEPVAIVADMPSVAAPSVAPEPTAPKPTATATFTADVPAAKTMRPPPPPPPPPRVLPTGVAPTRLPDLAGYNDEFMIILKRNGWTIWNSSLMVQRGHSTCSMLRDGEPRDLISRKLMGVEPQLTYQMAYAFTQIVTASYPNCP